MGLEYKNFGKFERVELNGVDAELFISNAKSQEGLYKIRGVNMGIVPDYGRGVVEVGKRVIINNFSDDRKAAWSQIERAVDLTLIPEVLSLAA